MKAIEAFQHLPATKAEVSAFSERLISELQSGEIDALKFKIFLKCIEAVGDNIKTVLDEMARKEAEKYGAEFTMMGATVRLKETGTKYDYSGCGDPRWETADAEVKAMTRLRKEREDFLKALKSSTTIVDEETGEVITLRPPMKSSTSSITITL